MGTKIQKSRHFTTKTNQVFMEKQLKFKQRNQLKNRFNSSSIDQVWTLDFTSLESSWLLTVQDQTTRQIIIHRILFGKNNGFKSKDVVSTLDECIRNRQRPNMVHSHSGKQFTSKEYVEFLERQDIKYTLGHGTKNDEFYKMHNQVHERFHRTLKGEIRKILQDHCNLPHKPRELKIMAQLEEDQVASIVNQAINNFNNLRSSAKTAFGASPNIMEDALVLFGKDQPNVDLLGATGTKKGDEIAQLKANAIEEYSGDWVAFFVDWKQQAEKRYQETVKRHQEALQLALDNKEEVIDTVIKQKKLLALQNKELRQQLKLIAKQVAALEEEMLRKAQLERVEQERKERRRARERKPSRAAATFQEYQEAIKSVDSVTKNSFVAARERVCLLFLYISGARVSNCLKLNVFHLYQMLQGNTFYISEIKSKETKHLSVTINQSIHSLITERQHDIEKVCQGKEGNDLVITAKGKREPLDNSNLDKKLNQVLSETSKVLRKNLKTHSFRIGLTTSLIEVAGVEAAQKIIGHSNLTTTAVYNRAHYKEKDYLRLMRKAEKFRREKGLPRHYRKKSGEEEEKQVEGVLLHTKK